MLIVEAALLVAIVAGEPQQRTDCRQVGQTFTCETQTQQPAPPMTQFDGNAALRAYGEGRRARAESDANAVSSYERESRQIDIVDRVMARGLINQAGPLIVAGKCRDATDLMLKAGRFDLADLVADACARRAKQTEAEAR